MFEGFESVTLENVFLLKPFFEMKKSHFCDFTLGVKYMWEPEYHTKFKILDDTLILYEVYDVNKCGFYYPIGKNVEKAFDYIEHIVREKNLCLEFLCLTQDEVALLAGRYHHYESYSDRNWSEYIYDKESFMTFGGKHLSSKRHALTAFKEQNPNYVFKVATESDIPHLLDFYNYDKKKVNFESKDQKFEYDQSINLIKNFYKLNMKCGFIEVNGFIVSYSINEIMGDVMFDHVEKGLYSYEGSYQILINETAKAFAQDVKYISREDDNGDLGLRTSKLQYHPLAIEDKYFFAVKNRIDSFHSLPTIVIGDNLVLSEISEQDKDNYYKMTADNDLNKYWGYDYHQDIDDINDNPNGVYNSLKNDFEIKDSVSFAIKLNNILIGEAVIYNFDNLNSGEVGLRIIKEQQGHGYASKALLATINFLIKECNYKKIRTKCFRENFISHKLINRCGFKEVREDDKFIYFEINI
jgi:RimJ/RimL family protein N-acetyltransferase